MRDRATIILLVVTMVTVIGILGTGFFGAGMRAVQEREENILRRYKVTPITPVPLLLASIVMGVILYLPSVALMLVLAKTIYGMHTPPNLFSLFAFVCLGVAAFRAFGLIIAAVVNSEQESNILIQMVYMPMLFLSGATHSCYIHAELAPGGNAIHSGELILSPGFPASCNAASRSRKTGSQSWRLWLRSASVFLSRQNFFRWEKEEKLRPGAKLWVIVVLLPFFILGSYQAWSRQDLTKTKILARDRARGRSWLIQNARIFVGNGKVIESGAVLVRGGKIDNVYEGNFPEAKTLNAEAIDAAGKTVLPGLIDVHVHLGAPGGFYDDTNKCGDPKNAEHELEAYLYCGITAVRSVGDALDAMLRLHATFGTGEKLGTDLFSAARFSLRKADMERNISRTFPKPIRSRLLAQSVRLPKTPDEGRAQVDELARQGVNAIKGILDAGVPGYSFNRMGVDILRAVVDEAHAKHLPVAVHTADKSDVADALAVGADSVEHGSFSDEISDEDFAQMKAKGIAYDPTLSVVEGFTSFAKGDTSLLKRSLAQQVTSKELMTGTENAAHSDQFKGLRDGISHYPMSIQTGGKNLLKAWRAGVMLVTGSDAGNFLVMHGPTVQHEIELWVAAGIPVDVALQAATSNAAKLLRADNRIGTLEKGRKRRSLVVDGNPLQDVRALSSISVVMMKGERVVRSELFEQK